MSTFYTPSQAAAILQVCRQTIYRWIAQGILRSVKIGGAVRIPEEVISSLQSGTPSKEEVITTCDQLALSNEKTKGDSASTTSTPMEPVIVPAFAPERKLRPSPRDWSSIQPSDLLQ